MLWILILYTRQFSIPPCLILPYKNTRYFKLLASDFFIPYVKYTLISIEPKLSVLDIWMSYAICKKKVNYVCAVVITALKNSSLYRVSYYIFDARKSFLSLSRSMCCVLLCRTAFNHFRNDNSLLLLVQCQLLSKRRRRRTTKLNTVLVLLFRRNGIKDENGLNVNT